nr:hypothetical protein [uncultured archaeon]
MSFILTLVIIHANLMSERGIISHMYTKPFDGS